MQIVKMVTGYILQTDKLAVQKALIDDIINAVDGFDPQMSSRSSKWKNWISKKDLFTCGYCAKMHGCIFEINDPLTFLHPAHMNCRCEIETLLTIIAGNATREGQDGADFWLKNYGRLPYCYISKKDAKLQGWKPIQGNLDQVLPNMMIGEDIYKNRNGHLPYWPGRVWYEADINYTGGFRTRHRILYSNDGLVFVTYDHYETFIEIV